MACVNVCTHNAISMQPDDEGFLRPEISQDLCRDCGLCSKICPVNLKVLKAKPLSVYSGWSKDDSIRMASSSGGAFTEIARPILERGGVVFGCALDSDLKAVHTYVESMEDLTKLRGSKYVQSYIGDSYRQAKKFLVEGREVLFSGTPCQIAGLKAYLRKDYNNLWTVDLICHGVPSPLMYEEYKSYIESKYNDKIKDIKFRSKKVSWSYYGMSITFRNNSRSYYGNYFSDPYIRGFLRDYFLRPSCHQCQYTTEKRVSDFTIADWWKYKQLSKKDKDCYHKGVSLILVNSEKAQNAIGGLGLDLVKKNIESAHATNECLHTCTRPSDKRCAFWLDYKKNRSGFESVIKYMTPQHTNYKQDILKRIPNTDRTLYMVGMFDRIINLPIKFVNILSGKYSLEKIVSKFKML